MDMNFMKRFVILLLALVALSSIRTQGQSLRGKIIYVSSSQEVILKFRSGITNFSFTPKESASLFERRLTNNKNFSISSTIENFNVTNLIILEGDNTHLFILEYKEKLDPRTETLYDFSSKEKLRNEAEKIDLAAKDASSKGTVDTTIKVTNTSNTTTTKEHTSTAEEINNAYSELATKANQAFLKKNFDEAKDFYTRALVLKPNDPWCISQIQWIDNQKNARQVEDQQKTADLSFKKHVQSGDSAFDKKSYDVARFAYNDALREKPGDSHVKNQLLKIDQALKEDSYKSFMSIGADALSNQLFDNAENAYKEALKIKPNDPEAKKGLIKISTAKTAATVNQKADQIRIEKENQYNDTVALADNMFDAGLYVEARKKYMKADKMRPGETRVKVRISEIDSIMSKRKAEVSKAKQDSINAVSYQNEIEKGNKAFEAKDYKKAKSSFEMAQKLKPQEKYPAERISATEVMLTQIEEEKKAEVQRKALEDANNKKYSFSIKQGSAAVNKGEYEVAKAFYLQAQDLKPAEKLPATQLQIINAKLAEIRDNKMYENFLHLGDSSYIAKDLKTALRWYDSARLLKPTATYPNNQIIAVNKALMLREDIARKNKRTEEFEKALPTFKKADALRLERKYEEAYKGYTEFLNQIDTFNINEYLITERYYVKQAKDFLVRLEQYKPKPTVDTITKPIDGDDKKKKKKKNKSTSTGFKPTESSINIAENFRSIQSVTQAGFRRSRWLMQPVS